MDLMAATVRIHALQNGMFLKNNALISPGGVEIDPRLLQLSKVNHIQSRRECVAEKKIEFLLSYLIPTAHVSHENHHS